MSTIEKRIRKSQLITQFGIGAIVEIGNESFIGADLAFRPWSSEFLKKKYRIDPIPRLEKILKIPYIVSPPSAPPLKWKTANSDDKYKLPYSRFPRWLICRSCNSLRKYNQSITQNPNPSCLNSNCSKPYDHLQPVRFIYADNDGYLFDIAWDYLLHLDSAEGGCRDDKNLYMNSEASKGGGLSSIFVECSTCGIKKNLAQIKSVIHRQRNKEADQFHPWQVQSDAQYTNNKSKASRVLSTPFQQAGSSSLYQSKIVSALDLSGSAHEVAYKDMTAVEQYLEEMDAIETLKGNIDDLKDLFDSEETFNNGREKLITNRAKSLNKQKPLNIDEITSDLLSNLLGADVEEFKAEDIDLNEVSDSSLLYPEWQVLHQDGENKYKNYHGIKNEIRDPNISKYISSITQVRKLREVRVLYGFTRYFDSTNVHPLYMGPKERKPPYLPGIEVFGEGIFIQLNIETLNEWLTSQSNAIKSRLESMVLRQAELSQKLPFPSPEFVLMHTFSHLLMNQLCFESGYGMSSVREKIYVNLDQGMCGVLIYTADSDSEGALGGLVRMGDEKRIVNSILAMIDSAKWCSTDPACIEIGSPGMGGINKAACHSCALISETSCAHFNSLLDRGVLVGSDEENLKGFFDGLLQ